MSPKCVIQMPQQFIDNIITIVDSLSKWIQTSIASSNVSHLILNKKLEAINRFSSVIKRNLAFREMNKVIILIVLFDFIFQIKLKNFLT